MLKIKKWFTRDKSKPMGKFDKWLRSNTLSTWGYSLLSMLLIDSSVWLFLILFLPDLFVAGVIITLLKVVTMFGLKLVFPEISKYYIHDLSVRMLSVIVGLIPLIYAMLPVEEFGISFAKGCLLFTYSIFMANREL